MKLVSTCYDSLVVAFVVPTAGHRPTGILDGCVKLGHNGAVVHKAAVAYASSGLFEVREGDA
jgi:hypothetical protein